MRVLLTHRDREKMTAILQIAFSNAFSWIKMIGFRSKCYWRMTIVPWDSIDNMPALAQIMAWHRVFRRQAIIRTNDRLSYRRICVTWPQFIQTDCRGSQYETPHCWSIWITKHSTLPRVPLTHLGRYKTAAIFQTTFWNAFSWMKIYGFRLRFHWSLFLRFELTTFQHCFR